MPGHLREGKALLLDIQRRTDGGPYAALTIQREMTCAAGGGDPIQQSLIHTAILEAHEPADRGIQSPSFVARIWGT